MTQKVFFYLVHICITLANIKFDIKFLVLHVIYETLFIWHFLARTLHTLRTPSFLAFNMKYENIC